MKKNLVNVPGISSLIEKEYDDWCQRNGVAPLYALCMIQYKDDKSTLEVTIKMDSGCEDDEEDENIFFYCNSFSGLKSLTDPDGVEDFYITDFFYFC